jgi:predicted ATPase/transcriptional regulator with XRE-family HTH domain
MDEAKTSFGALLRRLRTDAALSQEALAKRSGLSRTGISGLERGLHPAPHLETVRLLADGLGLADDERAALLAAARPALQQPASVPSPSPSSTRLPAPLTRLIGREAEVATVCGMLRDKDIRLVTVTGPGGVGKTRLAIAVGAEMADANPNEVVFVDLTPLTDPSLVLPTLASSLGVQEGAGHPLLETLVNFLMSKRLLLVLDNCERVLAAAPELTRLLAFSPGLTVLATSREPFHVRGEFAFPLSPLPLAATDQPSTLEELALVPAVALFAERARAARPDFTLREDNRTTVAAICRRLDGLPLAIELAAARVKVLPPAALLTRLDQRLPLLTGGGQDLPARQRTMRDAIAWSYDLLSPAEQILFRRLSIFAGGFTLSAADAVIAAESELPVLDGVGALVDQSLLRVAGEGDEPRYRMLETVREFGLEQLAAAGEVDEAGRLHATHFLRLAEDLAQGTPLLVNLQSLTRVAAEQDNLRGALTWFDEHAEIDALVRLSTSLYGLWLARGHYREGLRWLGAALKRSHRTACAGRMQALVAAGMLAIFRGDYARAGAFSREAGALASELNAPLPSGHALTLSGFLALRQGDYGQAEVLLDEAYLT